eukprot:gnl/MRDRNA2_/MRDRNA2_79540_c0_seq1.p1 gnl/MRDRNA2_/MRDRNA2_79540_c0~~gnl/MRDRNA2_/MRDRNA2_79540_c0_seq1.p1  ORF type:complete len:622 (-),score=87.86 gnl/MRDRNA2_/MRDRNA2_79540_c0_seq1:15-1880(-)
MNFIAISLLLLQITIPAAGLRIQVQNALESGEPEKTATPITIEAFFINIISSTQRADCMNRQLSQIADLFKTAGVNFIHHRYPGVEPTQSSIEEALKSPQMAQCFPSNKVANLTHPGADINEWKGVLGNTCAHMKLVDMLSGRKSQQADYYMMFEDDVVFNPENFVSSVVDFVKNDKGHYTLLALDTFQAIWHKGQVVNSVNKKEFMSWDPPKGERATGELDIYSFSSAWGYWGAHSWLLPRTRLAQFRQHMHVRPTAPLDWYPKMRSQHHISFMAFQTNSVRQFRFADQAFTDMAALPKSCLEMSVSDIVPPANEAKTFSKIVKNEPQVAPKNDLLGPDNEVIILGMYDTGTNLFHNLLVHNIEEVHNVSLCKDYSGWAYCGQVWKHTHPSRLAEAQKFRQGKYGNNGDFKSATAVVIVRHPFSLIESIRSGQNYDVDCGNFALDDTCMYITPTGQRLKNQAGNSRVENPICVPGEQACWPSMAAAWNSYTEGYLKTLPDLFKHVEILRYEDIVELPQDTMQRLGVDLEMDLDFTNWTPQDAHAKKLGGDHASSLKKLQARDYGAKYSEEEKQQLCAQLDHGLMNTLGYKGCHDATKEPKFEHTVFSKNGPQIDNIFDNM